MCHNHVHRSVELTRCTQTLKSKLDKCVQKTKKERKEHESIRDSTTRRLAHKLTGKKEKFEQKASKEEKCVRRGSPCDRLLIVIVREYIEALEEEMKVRNSLETNEQMIVEAKATVRVGIALSCGADAASKFLTRLPARGP